MSSSAFTGLKKYPYLTKYAQSGLINFNALARLIGQKRKLSAVAMELRRYVAKLPKVTITPFDFSKYSFQLVTRTNVHEIILTKTIDNREMCLKVVNQVSQTKYFITLVEGEKEIVVMTDYPLMELINNPEMKKVISHFTQDLGFISVNFPIEMRGILGIYSLVTSSLAEAYIPIHSFHTIGGEILILVKNSDLVKTQEVLQFLFFRLEPNV